MIKYTDRSKSELFEAFKYCGKESLIEAPEWIKRAFDSAKLFFDAFGNLLVRTSIGIRHVIEGSYILLGDITRDFFVCSSNKFDRSYEVV